MAQPTLFAAPEVAAHGGAAGGAVSVTLALLLVVAFIAVLAWFARRARGGLLGAKSSRIQVLSSQALGVKESVVLVRVGDTHVLVGVAPGSVRSLHVFPPGASVEAPPAETPAVPGAPNFKELMLKSLGLGPK